MPRWFGNAGTDEGDPIMDTPFCRVLEDDGAYSRNEMRLTEAVIALLAFAGSLQAGAITSGSLFFGDMQETAILSGTNFHATVNDYDFSPFPDGGFAPLSWI